MKQTIISRPAGLSMYQGLYINLARSEKRRIALTRHLEELGAASRYQRIEAVDGSQVAHQFPTTLPPGALGLWLSHLKALEAARGTDAHLHIIEDDAIFAKNAVPHFERILAQADAELGNWDIFFTDVQIPPQNIEVFRQLSRMIKGMQPSKSVVLVDLRAIDFSCTSSLFVNRQSYEKYAKLMSDKWMLNLPLDLFLRQIVRQGQLKAFLTVPFLTSLSADTLHSEIRGEMKTSLAAATIYRRAFFQDADLSMLNAEMQALTSDAEISSPRDLTDLYLKTVLIMLSDNWKSY